MATTERKLRASIIAGAILFVAWLISATPSMAADSGKILTADSFKHYVSEFNSTDKETVINAIPNASAYSWMADNVPRFECPDKQMEKTYYFRWWEYRKHIVNSPEGFVVTEFLPNASWAKNYNTINCAAGHHIYEGRWLRDSKYMNDYSKFYFAGTGDAGGASKCYSTWLADAVYSRYLVSGDKNVPVSLLSGMVKNYEAWGKDTSPNCPQNPTSGSDRSRLLPNGLYWQFDAWDGMEYNVSRTGARPTINSYMYGDALAIAKTAQLAGNTALANQYYAKAAAIKTLVQGKLWNSKDQFFETRAYDSCKSYWGNDPVYVNDTLVGVREEIGFIPWYFNLPDGGQYNEAWKQLIDPKVFAAKYGITTVDQRSPYFKAHTDGCYWDGMVWPYATSQTLTALANLLNNYQQDVIGKKDYFNALQTYSESQKKTLANGAVVSWIDEDMNPNTGIWTDNGMGKDYNHSSYCDLIISGLVGLRPRADDILEINPLVPDGTWDYFCLDDVEYHGKTLTIFWDKTGAKYGHGAGLQVWVDGVEIAHSDTLTKIEVSMTAIPEPASLTMLAAVVIGLLACACRKRK